MKLAALLAAAAVALAGCKDRNRDDAPAAAPGSAATTPAPAPPAPIVPRGLDACKLSTAALDGATCPTPEVRQQLLGAKKAIDDLVATVAKVGGPAAPQFQVMCAQMLLAIERDADAMQCSLAISAGERKDLGALIEAWYGQRTPVAATGDAPSDAMIAKLVAVRASTCECRDAACLEKLEPQLAAVGTLPDNAPKAARDLAGNVIDDISRCASRVRTMAPPPPR